MGAVITAFSFSASPYVTVAQAKTASGDRLHLAGDIIKPTVSRDVRRGSLTFDLRDDKGDTITVVHRGEMPANFSEAVKVVAIGGMKDGQFQSNQLLVKCPSKYEAEKAGAG